MATSYYSTGTVSLTNGSAVVTGVGTLWQTALITSGFLFVQAAEGNPLPIASVDSDSQITAELDWTGATGTYTYALLRQTDQLQDNAENSRALSYLISEMRNGTLFKYDVAGTLADRALYDERPKGFSYLVLAGENAQLYVKASATSGDWAGPFAYGTGPVGPMGPAGFITFRGDYNPATNYVRNDGVRYNGSSWVALQSTTGNAPPNLPTTSNTYWSLIAIKGEDGAGTGDMQTATYDPQNKQTDAFDSANHDYENTASGLAAATVQGAIDELASRPATPNGAPFVRGLILSNNSSDAANDIDISTGEALNGTLYVVSSSVVAKRLDASWVAGHNNGGLDTGTKAANTTYHVYAIRKQSDGSGDFIFSLSPSSPSVPVGYDLVCRVGSILTESSGSIRAFVQDGNIVRTSLVNEVSTTSTIGEAFRVLSGVPTGVSVEAMIFTNMSTSASGASASFSADHGFSSASTGVYGYRSRVGVSSGTDAYQGGVVPLRTTTSKQIKLAITITGSASVDVFSCGWVDHTVPRVGG